MKSPTVLGLTLTAIAVGGFVYARSQRDELLQLRRRVAPPTSATRVGAPASDPGSSSGAAPGAVEVDAATRVELMALRAKVTELQQRRQEWSGVSNENVRLRAGLRDVTNRLARGVSEGFIRVADMRDRGRATPEAALETFFWAMKARNANAILPIIPEAARPSIANQLAEKNGEAFFGAAARFPGFKVVSRTESGSADVQLGVELAPGTVVPMKFHREETGWTMELE